jgi:alkanesulfonate monooxygenase SsuD/methylene tetrahydromethanopterin reductase-like flavin-dependent oxidoreductase (luciferase family)
VMKAAPGKSTATYAAGGDMTDTVAGSPETVAAKVQQLADIGINHLHVRFLGEWAGETRQIAEDSAVLFAKEVMPRFAAHELTLS